MSASNAIINNNHSSNVDNRWLHSFENTVHIRHFNVKTFKYVRSVICRLVDIIDAVKKNKNATRFITINYVSLKGHFATTFCCANLANWKVVYPQIRVWCKPQKVQKTVFSIWWHGKRVKIGFHNAVTYLCHLSPYVCQRPYKKARGGNDPNRMRHWKTLH